MEVSDYNEVANKSSNNCLLDDLPNIHLDDINRQQKSDVNSRINLHLTNMHNALLFADIQVILQKNEDAL